MKQTIAVFDFDGTITTGDSFLPLLITCFGWKKTLWKLFLISPMLILFPLGIITRQRAKEATLTKFFRGWTLQDLEKVCQSFAKEKLPEQVKPEALKRIAWHRSQNHPLILVSASIDVYLKPWGKEAGFEHVIASLVETADGKITGKLVGKNCRCEEKVRRLQEVLGDLSLYEIYAYGDSDGDRELLAAADHPFYRKLK